MKKEKFKKCFLDNNEKLCVCVYVDVWVFIGHSPIKNVSETTNF